VSQIRELVCFKLVIQIRNRNGKTDAHLSAVSVPPSLPKETKVIALADGFAAQLIQLNIAGEDRHVPFPKLANEVNPCQHNCKG
jgi:hypothetical protein